MLIRIAKTVKVSCAPFTQLLPKMTSYVVVIKCQNQENDIGVFLVTRQQTLFSFHGFFLNF